MMLSPACRSLEVLVLQHCMFDDPPPASLMQPPPTLRHFSLRSSVICKPASSSAEDSAGGSYTNFHPGFFADVHQHCPHLETLVLPPLRYYNLLDCPGSHIAPSLFRRLADHPPSQSPNTPEDTPSHAHLDPTTTPPPIATTPPTPPPPASPPAPPEDSPDFEPVQAFQQWLQVLPDEHVPQAYTDHPFQLPQTLSFSSSTLTSLELTLAEEPTRPRSHYYYRESVLSHLPGLHSLTIAFSGTFVTALRTNLPALSACTLLTTLRLHSIFCDLRTFRRFATAALPALVHLRHLEAKNFCVPPSTADLFQGPHREVLSAAAALTGLRHLQICQDRPRCNFDMMPARIAPVAMLTRLTFLELSPMRWLPPDVALAAAGGADGAVPADVPGHLLQVVEWAGAPPDGEDGGVAAALAAEINLAGLRAVLSDCAALRELHLPSLVPVTLEASALRVRPL